MYRTWIRQCGSICDVLIKKAAQRLNAMEGLSHIVRETVDGTTRMSAYTARQTQNRVVCKRQKLAELMENYDFKTSEEKRKKVETQQIKLTGSKPKVPKEPSTAGASCYITYSMSRASQHDRTLCTNDILRPRHKSKYVPYPFEHSDPSSLDDSEKVTQIARLKASTIVKIIKQKSGPKYKHSRRTRVTKALEKWEDIITEHGPRPEHDSIVTEENPEAMWKNIYGRIQLDYGSAKTQLPFWQDMFAETLHDAHLLYDAPVRAPTRCWTHRKPGSKQRASHTYADPPQQHPPTLPCSHKLCTLWKALQIETHSHTQDISWKVLGESKDKNLFLLGHVALFNQSYAALKIKALTILAIKGYHEIDHVLKPKTSTITPRLTLLP